VLFLRHGLRAKHPATHCNTTHCNTLQRTATHCNTLQHTATPQEEEGKKSASALSAAWSASKTSAWALPRRLQFPMTAQVCCSVLPCVAVCCGMLQYVAVCVAVCCSVLQCVAVTHHSVIWHTATRCNHTAKHCNKLQQAATSCNMLQHTHLLICVT